MAVLNPEVSFNFKPLVELNKQYPEMSGRLLALVGKRGRQILKQKYLSGQEIDLRAFPTDRAGRYTITSNVNRKRNKTTIASYPMNLFDRGRRLRDGSRQRPKNVFKTKLKQDLMRGMPRYIVQFEKEILQPTIKKVGAK